MTIRLHRDVVCVIAALAMLSGSSTPASAQSFLNGDWAGVFHEDQPDRIPGPELGDFTGLPVNDAARLFADSWDASRLTLPEHQCRAHAVPYINRGPVLIRISEEKDPQTQQTVAIKLFMSTYAQERTVHLDGRSHPPDFAPHTWMGFSTGEWMGNVLRVTTTHIKQGWHRRNGLPQSVKTRLTEYFFRHGDVLTHVTYTEDPVFLEEPLVKTTSHRLNPNAQPGAYQGWLFCQADDEVPGRDPAGVPHYLPSRNPFSGEFTMRHNLPAAAARGGARTMYPEFAQTLEGASR